MTCREAIIEALKRAGAPRRAAALARAIADAGLYARSDGKALPAYQVYSIAYGNPDDFEIDGGLIALRSPVSSDTPDPDVAKETADAEPDDGRKPRGQRVVVGIAGEHFVAGELSRQGWIVGLTAKNTASVDLLAKKDHSARTLSIQVKSRTNAYKWAWRVGRLPRPKDCDFYVLVDLKEADEAPAYFVVPIHDIIKLWTNEQIRTRDVEQFKDGWDLLEKPTPPSAPTGGD